MKVISDAKGATAGTSQPLRGESIVYFGPEPWDGLWRNRHQLMSRLARYNKVLYVEPPIMDLKKREVRRLAAGSADTSIFIDGLARVAPQLTVLRAPSWLPFIGKHPLNHLKGIVWRRILRRTLRKLDMQRPVVWLSRPSMVDMLNVLGEKLSIYHVVDEYSGYGGVSESAKTELIEQEKLLLTEADLTIVVSKPLLASKRDDAKRIEMVANAVDYEAYRPRVAPDTADIPEDLASIPRPIIGYSGLVGRRLNLEMLAKLASRRSDLSFVLVGAVRRDNCEEILEKLESLRNVYFLGLKSIIEIAGYVRSFDVCMVPYRYDERAENASPLKLYEYAAAEKPIVTSRFSAAEEMKDIAMIAADAIAFENSIDEALVWPATHARIVAGANMARENTWDHRVRQVENIISDFLK